MVLNRTKKKNFIIVAIIFATFICSFSFGVSFASAYTATINTSNSIELDIAPTGDGTSIHSESINIQSDCRAGYNLTIATPEGSNLYKDGNSGNGTAFTAVDGTSVLSSSNNTNKWGYTLTSNPTSSTVFSPLSSTESVLKTTSQTASPSADINDTFSINYGAKVDSTITPGTYQMANNGAIVYYLTMDTTCTQYTVSFNPNGGTGTMNNQSIETGEPTKLTSSGSLTAPTGGSYTDADNNTITGDPDKLWTFWGWNTQADGTGDWYKDKEAVTDLANVGTTITLYAQWAQPTLADMIPGTPVATEKVIDHDLMQDMKPEVCWNSPITTAENAPAATLKDYRGKVTTGSNPESPEQYTVSKLADGLCWMTTNLNLGRSGTDGPNGDGTVTLTSEDTDLATDTTFTLPAHDTTSSTTSTNARIRTTNTSGTNANGTYYSWAAAVANTTSISTNPTTSICPKNWDLPASSQYTNLNTKSSYSSTNSPTNAPSSFLANGKFTNGATFYPTSSDYGFYWTSTSSSTTAAYGARVTSSALSTSASTGTTQGGNKYYRKNIRCVASQGTATINYDGNGSDGGSMTNQTNVEISSTKLNSNAFTRTHYTFKNWNTAADGSGTTIANSATVASFNSKPGDTITLYAQWTPQRQIIYNDNCSYNNAGCATNEDATGISNWTNAGTNITLGSDIYFTTRTGYVITSWNTARDGSGTSYNISSSYTVPSNLSTSDQVTLYAMWSPALTINFNSNGGTGTMTAQLIPENTSKALKSNGFTAPSGNYFIGWMTEESRATNTVVYANGATYTTPATVTPGDSITLYAKWGPKYTIVYNGNNATSGSMISDGTELKHTNINEGANINLYAPNYYKTNHGFVGWSPSPTATVGGTDPIYGPNESISAPDYALYGQEISGTKTITLYAIWTEADSTKTMQTFTLSDCQNMAQATYNSTTSKITAPTGSVIALKDQRDGNVYTVARLADGNCWMTENLRLEAANTVGNNQYDSTVTNESLAQGYGGVFIGLDSTENSNFTDTTNATPNNMYNSTNVNGNYSPGYRFPRYNNNNTNTNLTASYNGTGSNTYYSWYSYGNYYIWAAAMANTASFSSSTGVSASEYANTSLCPTNCTMPTSGSTSKDFSTLTQHYDGTFNNQSGSSKSGDTMSNRFRSFPNNFLYSGYFSVSSASDRGSRGYYVSRSADSNNYSFYLYLYSTYLGPSYDNGKYVGSSVRCLIDNTYTIQYNGNNATGGNMINNINELKHSGLIGGETITLYPSNYYRTGYGFAGWSTDPDAWTHFTDNDNTNDPVIYGPMETITAPARTVQTITLYAVWVPAEKDGNNNPVYLQDFDSTSCSSLTSTTYDSTTGVITVNKNSIVALTDKRDGNVYTVARLADGNCWMTENLRLEAANTVGNNQYDSSVTNESLSQGYGGVFTGLDSAENSNFSNTTNATPNNLYSSTNITGSYTGYRFPRYNNNNTNISLTARYDGNSIGNIYYSWYSYGNYYTWAAAMANTTHYSSHSGTNGSNTAGTSICPTNWVLPVGSEQNTSGSFHYLNQEMGKDDMTQGSREWRSFPNNFLLSGTFSSTSSNNRGSHSHYWSRSAYSDTQSYELEMDAHNLDPSNFSVKYVGYNIRCLVASPHTVTVNLGQHVQSVSFTDSLSNTQTVTSNGGAVTLKEAPYTISATYDNGYEFNSWSTTGGRLDSTTSASTTYSVISNETLSITAKEIPYTIVYNGNNATGGSMISDGTELKHTNIKEGDEVRLYAPNYYKTNYGFVGWSTDSDAWTHFTDNDNTNDPVIYGPMETITAPARTVQTITLYAVWVPAEKDGNNNPVYLQDFDSTSCSSLTSTTYDSTTGVITVNKNSIVALTDKRDGNVYTVARLADGNCWMTENLRLEAANTVGNNQYDSSVTNESLSQGYGGVFTGLDSAENSNFSNTTNATPNNLYSSTNITGSYTGYRFPRYNNNNTNISLTASYNGTGSSTYYSWYSYGNYYTWAAAMANINYYAFSSTSEAAGTSICPSGWHLPSSDGAAKEYGTLSQRYGGTGNNQDGTANAGDIMSNRFRSFPNNFIYSGYFDGSSAYGRGTNGNYWSRSTNGYDGGHGSYFLNLNSTYLYPSSGGLNKSYGFSVRCLIGS